MLKAYIPKRTFTRTLGGWRLEGLCPQHPWGSCDKGCWKSLRVVFAWTLFNRCWNQRQLKAPPPQRNHVYKNLQPMAQVTKEDRHRFEWWPQEAHPFIRLVLQRLFLNYPCTILSNNRLITILLVFFVPERLLEVLGLMSFAKSNPQDSLWKWGLTGVAKYILMSKHHLSNISHQKTFCGLCDSSAPRSHCPKALKNSATEKPSPKAKAKASPKANAKVPARSRRPAPKSSPK